jgi:hypothetical protein
MVAAPDTATITMPVPEPGTLVLAMTAMVIGGAHRMVRLRRT